LAATRFQFLAPILLAAASTLPAFSQTVVTSGTIRGLVTDPTGAVIYDAIVDVVQQQTGVSSTSRSNHGGLFVFSALPIGPYSVKVSAPGFQTGEMKDVSVTVGQATAADFVLHPGAATQVMLVTAKTPTLRTTDSTLSAIVDRDNLNNLPLSGRRYTDFSLLTPNSTPDGQAGLVSFAGEQGGEDTGYANGNGANSFTLDGASATSNYFGNARGGERVPYVFGENAIQEFQVAVSPYSAAYGGGATDSSIPSPSLGPTLSMATLFTTTAIPEPAPTTQSAKPMASPSPSTSCSNSALLSAARWSSRRPGSSSTTNSSAIKIPSQ